MPAEILLHDPDSDGAIFIHQVISQSDSALVDNGGGLLNGVEIVEHGKVGTRHVLNDIAFIGQEHDHAFGSGPLFELIYFFYRFVIGGVTADAPDRIGRIQDEPALIEDFQTFFHIMVEFHAANVIHQEQASKVGDLSTLFRMCFIGAQLLSLQKLLLMEQQQLIAEAWNNRELVKENKYTDAVRAVIEEVDKGRLRVAQPDGDNWKVNEWVKQAILLYFATQNMQTWTLEPFEFHDKMVLKKNYKDLGVRAVPHAIARYGAYLGKNVVLMPSYVNIGAYVDEGTMVDTWATVGSCAQIGKGVHLSGGVGIGGVLEPLQASPVIIEDGAFIGSRCIVVEGVRVEKEAVLGANVVLTQSTKIIDVSGAEPVEYKGRIPARSVVIPGSYTKKFPAGEYGVSCALIIGQRKPSTDLKTSLNDALRDFNVSV